MTTAQTCTPTTEEVPPPAALQPATPTLQDEAAGAPNPAQPPSGGVRSLGRTFFMLNTIEMWERLAYFAVRTVVPIYIMQADDPGGLHLTAGDKGTIYGVWFILQSILPMFTGGFADRYGYKRPWPSRSRSMSSATF